MADLAEFADLQRTLYTQTGPAQLSANKRSPVKDQRSHHCATPLHLVLFALTLTVAGCIADITMSPKLLSHVTYYGKCLKN